MKRLLFILAGFMVLFTVMVSAQPTPGDSTGIISGVPTGIGLLFLMVIQTVTGAILTFLTTKVATKFPLIKGWVTVAAGTVVGALVTLILGAILKALHIQTGITVVTGALGNYVLASIIHEYRQALPATGGGGPVVVGGPGDSGKT